MLKLNTKRIKGYLINLKFIILLLFIFASCHDNYQNCIDLDYGSEYIKIRGVEESDKNYFKYFCKTTEVFGVKIYATENVANDKIFHAASVLAQYLDNDEDGVVDNELVLNELVEKKVWLLMVENESELDAAIRIPPMGKPFQDLHDEEVTLINGSPRFDASLEEVLHLITQHGYAEVYPNIFGENKDSEIAKAMDIARGGYFKNEPNSYPSNAWYTYDDKTCDYSCQITEYTYWALTSILGGQNYPGRLDEIKQEWRLNTKEKVKNSDPIVFSLMLNPRFNLPTNIPDGKYRE